MASPKIEPIFYLARFEVAEAHALAQWHLLDLIQKTPRLRQIL
jgi:hypothetical protein